VKHPAVFTIAASAPFAETLARGLIARAGTSPLALSSAVIYLPTRRAARSFGDAFAKVMGGAALLPQFRPLGDSEEDELLFDAASPEPRVVFVPRFVERSNGRSAARDRVPDSRRPLPLR